MATTTASLTGTMASTTVCSRKPRTTTLTTTLRIGRSNVGGYGSSSRSSMSGHDSHGLYSSNSLQGMSYGGGY
ncbi:hypothetical protein L1887_03371 [Cichorium endivia]|nr:hypothetical protein L1887_03371 [Cichorium endivia]